MMRRNGQKCPISINAGRVDIKGAPAALFLVTDCTSTLRIEDELQKARHLESIAALSGGIAHDYNNLLTVIIGNISLIRSYTDSADIIYRLLNEAQEASMVAKSLTQKLITFSRGGLPVKETADMAALLRIVTEISLSRSNIKCQFSASMTRVPSSTSTRPKSAGRAHLVMNARKAIPKGGLCTVTARMFKILTVMMKIPPDHGQDFHH